jgi:hypothetical protein
MFATGSASALALFRLAIPSVERVKWDGLLWLRQPVIIRQIYRFDL